MVVATDFQKLRAELEVSSAVITGTSAVDAQWIDMRDKEHFLAVLARATGTGGITAFKLIGNSASDGSGTDVEIKVHAGPTVANAAGDQLVLECSAQELRQAAVDSGENLRYVSANVQQASADVSVVTNITSGKHEKNLTQDIIS